MKDFGIEVAIRGRRFRRRGSSGRPKVCMYVRLRSIPLRSNNVRSQEKHSVISQYLFSSVDAQAAIDISVHLQLTPRDSNLPKRTEPHLH